jgi:molybdate transport system substrate-binding protein
MIHPARLFFLSFMICLTIVFTACGMQSSNSSNSAIQGSDGGSHPTIPPAEQKKVELTISAAASLTDALKDVQKLYESSHPVTLNLNFGASGSLQQQIEQGAPVDVFLSASAKNMKALTDKGLIGSDKQRNLLTNDLVVIVPADGQLQLKQLSDLLHNQITKIAVGEPSTVPAGSYAKEALLSLKLWDPLQFKTVLAKDVRQVLTYVESGNTDAGFVYRTDAIGSTKVTVALTVDPGSYTPIEYPVGLLKDSRYPAEAQAFYDYLFGKEAQDIMLRYGFTLPK